MTRYFPVSVLPGFEPVARRWLADPPAQPAVPRPAATVMIVRDSAAGIEVFLLTRSGTMAFAASSVVFPGGGVDPRDGVDDLPWAGPSVAQWAQTLDADPTATRMLVVAAVREVFEECGVLFASRSADGPLADVSDPRWRQARAALVAREVSLHDVLVGEGLVLRSDLLRAHAHWITPEAERRRFDTRFFVAIMPAGQIADGQTLEAVSAGWFRPAEVLADRAAGRLTLLPPTQVCLEDLAGYADAGSCFGDRPALTTVQPRVVEREGQIWLAAPVPAPPGATSEAPTEPAR